MSRGEKKYPTLKTCNNNLWLLQPQPGERKFPLTVSCIHWLPFKEYSVRKGKSNFIEM